MSKMTTPRTKALPVNLDYITEELKLVAKNELLEDEATRVESLKSLRLLLSEVEDLRCQDEDVFLLAFLRARKFDVSRAFSLVKNFYSVIGKHGHLYYLGFEYSRRIMNENTFCVLSHRDSEGCAVVHLHLAFWDPSDISAEEHCVCATLGLLQALTSPSTQIAGFQIIADLQDFSFKHFLQFTPSTLWFIADIIQNSFPVRIRGIHFVNENMLFSRILPLFKRLLSNKLQDRFHIHGKDLKSLHEFFHPSILPANLGGELPAYDTSEWKDRMERSKDYIDHLLSFGYEKYLRRNGKE